MTRSMKIIQQLRKNAFPWLFFFAFTPTPLRENTDAVTNEGSYLSGLEVFASTPSLPARLIQSEAETIISEP